MPPIKAEGFHENKEINESSNLLFLKPGVTQLRILPAYSEAGKWFRLIKEIPRYVDGKYSPVVSPSTVGDPCPFEAEGRRLYNLRGEENIELAKKFRPRSSFLFNVVVQELPDMDLDIEHCLKVLKCGIKVKDQILDLDQDHSGGYGDITNLEKGFDIRITRQGKGKTDTSYTVKAIPKRSNILKWLEEKGFTGELRPFNLDEMFTPPPAEELQKIFEQFKEELSMDVPQAGDEGDPFRDVKKQEPTTDEMPVAPVESDNTEAPDLEA